MLDPARLVFIDETAVSTNMVRLRGRAPRGVRVIGAVPLGRWETITFVAALRHNKMVAPMVVEGAMTGEMFLAYVENCLVPTLRRNDIVVMDNCRVHLGTGIGRAIETVGATLRYLPKYSPDLNPIEMPYSKFKTFLRKVAARTIPSLNRAIRSFVKPFEDTGSNAGRLLPEPAGQIAQQPLGLVRVVELPGLLRRLAHGGVQRLGQALDHIAGLVWQRSIGVCRPKVERTHLRSASRSSTMNNRQTLVSRPRSIRLSMSACTTAAFSVAPSTRPSGCLLPSPSIPKAPTRTRSLPMCRPSIWITGRSSCERSEAIHSAMRSADSATNRREAADFECNDLRASPLRLAHRRRA